jgi:hypothetical protein
LNAPQSWIVPSGSSRLWSPSHVAGLTQAPPSQWWPAAQSASAAQLVLHAAAPHANGPHGTSVSAGQLPLPSHVAGRTAVPAAQDAARHMIAAPARPLQVIRFDPSHAAAEQGFPGVPAEQAGRVPCGAPSTGTHVPTAPVASHASHCPVHPTSQQTPSTQ